MCQKDKTDIHRKIQTIKQDSFSTYDKLTSYKDDKHITRDLSINEHKQEYKVENDPFLFSYNEMDHLKKHDENVITSTTKTYKGIVYASFNTSRAICIKLSMNVRVVDQWFNF